MIANGYSSMVMDLVALDALEPSGTALLARSARRLANGGRRLSIRSPSASMQQRLLADGLGDLIRDEEFQPMPATIGSRLEPVVLPSDLPTLERLSSSARVSALPTDNDLVDATLRLVVKLARTTVGGADGVSVSLRRHGLLATVAASDQTVLDMDTQQYARGWRDRAWTRRTKVGGSTPPHAAQRGPVAGLHSPGQGPGHPGHKLRHPSWPWAAPSGP